MKKWQQRFIAIATKLGFVSKVKEGTLSADEQKQIFAEYEKEYKVTFKDDHTANEDAETVEQDFILSETDQQEIANLINNSGTSNEGSATVEPPKTGKEANAALKKTVVEQKKVIDVLAATPEDNKPVAIIKAGEATDSRIRSVVMGHTAHSKTHLFGNECKFMSLGNWWNRITSERKEIDVSRLSEDDKAAFKKEFTAYGKALVDRSVHLTETNAINLLDYQKMIAGTSPFTDFTGLDAKFGEYTVRRQDIILAFFRSLPSVASIFPVQSGVRNKEVVPTVQFGELSQGWREGRIFKGNVTFASEIYWVNDVMFKYNFTDMVELQKRYVMELHRGSTDIQWTFIEWVIMWFGRQLFNEQQRRRVIGVRVPPQDVVANPAMLAADGALRAIQRAEEELKVLPFDQGIYDQTTIVDYIENFWDTIDGILTNMEDILLFVNLKHQPWYLRRFREKYGTDGDFTGTRNTLIDVNPRRIVWVPNMPMNNYKMWATSPGNIQNLEYLPNEMLGFIFLEEFESVAVRSRWMEGSVVQKVGVQYKTIAELEASKRQNQWLFTNFPVTKLEPGATTIDGKSNTEFMTGANTAATVLTDITNASEEMVYKIISGITGANATKITKSGKFAKISEDWTPNAVGDYIKLYAELEDYTVTVEGKSYKATRPTGNFLELGRKVTA